ncbi:hypothetical protein AHMF7605_10295 [Adhaeribacter arboris]|uniref:Uncharacterized protein n=1 Tax=Adhaeribacter arboris TaxID=2072846 RepID=A0A2T2YEJ6_9BACT|nr:hypothetical protein [Adhaeribacter arboris]PSR53878.1 hypothetical protein AHMF7605_10295 [Adhaeribacter arboris]
MKTEQVRQETLKSKFKKNITIYPGEARDNLSSQEWESLLSSLDKLAGSSITLKIVYTNVSSIGLKDYSFTLSPLTREKQPCTTFFQNLLDILLLRPSSIKSKFKSLRIEAKNSTLPHGTTLESKIGEPLKNFDEEFGFMLNNGYTNEESYLAVKEYAQQHRGYC